MIEIERSDQAGVCFVLGAGLTLGGTNIWAIQLARELAVRGVPVTLLEQEPVEGFEPLNVAFPNGVKRVALPQFGSGMNARTYYEAHKSLFADILPATLIPNDSVEAFALTALLSMYAPEDVRVMGVAHGESYLYYRWMKYYARCMHLPVAVNTAMRRELIRLTSLRESDIVVRPCPAHVPDTLSREYSDAGTALRLVYAGRLANGDKGVGKLVPLAQRLVELGVEFQLDIYGEGPYEACLQRDLSEASEEVSSRIRVMGRVEPDRMKSVWESADIVILVSNYESTGLSMLEGMAAGCVPVVTACSGPRDIIEHGVNGFMAGIEDVDAMAGCIEELFVDREQLVKMGREAFDSAKQNYSYDVYMPWFLGQHQLVWRQDGKPWPKGRSVFAPDQSRVRRYGRALKKLARKYVAGRHE